jgi:hypothetical protein
MFTVVTKDEATVEPYPYLLVNADGTARELFAGEKEYLETPFSPLDGNRPYVKGSYLEKNCWKNFRGFLRRSQLSAEVEVLPDPTVGFLDGSEPGGSDR